MTASKKKQAFDVIRRDLGLSDDERVEEGIVRLVRESPYALKGFFHGEHEGPRDVVALAVLLVEAAVKTLASDLEVGDHDDTI